MTGKLTMIGTMGIPVMTIKPETEIPLRHELKHRINLREDLVPVSYTHLTLPTT